MSHEYTSFTVVSLITRMDANPTTPGYMINQRQQSPELWAVGDMHGVNQFRNEIRGMLEGVAQELITQDVINHPQLAWNAYMRSRFTNELKQHD